MRDKSYFKEKMRKYRFAQELERRKLAGETCAFCNKPIETLHHLNENHADNRRRNLQNVCHEHHLKIPHGCDLKNIKLLKLPKVKSGSLTVTHFKPKLSSKGVRIPFLPENINDFLEDRLGQNKFFDYWIIHRKGHKWHLQTCSRKTLKHLAQHGFEKIYTRN